MPEVIAFSWPVTKAPGVTDFSVDAISRLRRSESCVSQSSPRLELRQSHLRSGQRLLTMPGSTSSPGHLVGRRWISAKAIIVAAAPGTIVNKFDGNFDRNCGFGSGNWNAVYVRTPDGSIAWYGHMKNGSPTAKNVGDTVAAGEYLGVVGRLGQFHRAAPAFRGLQRGGSAAGPVSGNDATRSTTSPGGRPRNRTAFRVSTSSRRSRPALFSRRVPRRETTNEKNRFQPGETLVTATYYRDQLIGQQTQYSILRPDGSTFQSWSHNGPDTYAASYWWWSGHCPSMRRGRVEIPGCFQRCDIRTNVQGGYQQSVRLRR